MDKGNIEGAFPGEGRNDAISFEFGEWIRLWCLPPRPYQGLKRVTVQQVINLACIAQTSAEAGVNDVPA